jgi:protein SCO1/2
LIRYRLLSAGNRSLVPVVLLLTLLSGFVQAAETPRVVVSIKPLHSLAAGLLEGVAEPYLLIDNDLPPWKYRPNYGDQGELAAADLLVWTGVELEPGLVPAVAALGEQRPVIEVLGLRGLKVLPARGDDHRRDPFVWLDTRNMLILLDTLAERLIQLDPGRESVYRRNWQALAEKLSQLDRTLEYSYRDVSGVPVFFYHDTHQYFEQAYAMHVAGSVVQVDGGERPDAASLLLTRAAMQSRDMACLFVERGLQEPNVDILTEGGTTRVVELDSLGSGLAAGPSLYLELMRGNFEAIASCVRAQKPVDVALVDFVAPDPSNSPRQLRPRYAMLDQHGRSVTHEDFRGRLQLIYFGYTFCPDICPTSLAILAQALRLLDDSDAEQIQPIFITVDPLRDTPEVLAEYVKYFHPQMLGLHAAPDATRRIAETFRARYEMVPSQSGDPDRYSMDHTSSLYLLGRQGEFITKFAHGFPAKEVASHLREYLQPSSPRLSEQR